MRFKATQDISPLDWKAVEKRFKEKGYNTFSSENAVRVILLGHRGFLNYVLKENNWFFLNRKPYTPLLSDSGWRDMTLACCEKGKVTIEAQFNVVSLIVYRLLKTFLFFSLASYGMWQMSLWEEFSLQDFPLLPWLYFVGFSSVLLVLSSIFLDGFTMFFFVVKKTALQGLKHGRSSP